MFTRKIRTGIMFSLILACVVMAAIAFYGDAPHMLAALAAFRWQYLPLILGLTLFNYFWRFIKWQYYLKRLKITVRWHISLLIFVSGLSMAITPGKVGELLKSYLLKRTTGEAISRTSPIIVAERLTDGIAMIGLAATGLMLYGFGWQLLLVLFVGGFLGILLIQNRPLALAVLRFGERLPVLRRFARSAYAFYESAYVLLRWQPLLLAICIGLISWSGECGALYFVYNGLGVAGNFDLFIKSMFILAVSSLIGSASGLPGGLGTADGSMLGLTKILISTSAVLGATATLLIRLCTFWFGLLLGVIALLTFQAIQGVDRTVELADGREPQDRSNSKISPTDADMPSAELASASASTGENVV